MSILPAQSYPRAAGALPFWDAWLARDPCVAAHSLRVREYSTTVAQVLSLPCDQVAAIRTGAWLHDVGKFAIPEEILQKSARLNSEELAVIRMHPSLGRRILEHSGNFEASLPIVELHHENHDGSGYPHRLRGDRIPLGARIVRVADSYDAMTSSRPYRSGMRAEQAIRVLREGAGIQFDPLVVEAFLAVCPVEPVVFS
ncbi:MAG: HD domain-containing protein [Acidobacteria bacterium]|nr:HD domain-containing protein [Acidobacteriota bacterium]